VNDSKAGLVGRNLVRERKRENYKNDPMRELYSSTSWWADGEEIERTRDQSML
jgi:hypothetical protein